MFGNRKLILFSALTALAVSASAFIPLRDGNVISREDAKTQSTGHEYDALNRLTNVVHEGQWKASFDHDVNGNKTEIRNQQSEVSFGYDELNRLTNSALTASTLSTALTVSSSYDLNGNRTNLVYPGGLVVEYEYDSENRLSSTILTGTTISTPLTISFSYDDAGRLTNIVYPNGVSGSFGYDGNGEVVAFSYGTASSNFIERAISRNANGFKMYENITAGLEPAAVQIVAETRTHDDADRLVSNDDSAATNNTAYGYDNNGNLTSSVSSVYSVVNSYDYENRLLETTKDTNHTKYLYDASGARVARITNNGSQTTTNLFVLHYSIDSNVPLCETDAQSNVTRFYIWTPLGLVAQIDTVAGGGDPGGTAYYFHSDELGNTLALTDGSGSVIGQAFYSPYGDTWAQSGVLPTPYRFGGIYGVSTEDNGLAYMQNRYYDFGMKRFINPDPTGLKGGVNFYTYANGNPLNSIDPEGLCARPSLFGRTSLFGRSSSGSSFGGFSAFGRFRGMAPSYGNSSSPFGFSSPQSRYARSQFAYQKTFTSSSGPSYRAFDDARFKWSAGSYGAAVGSAVRETFGRLSGFDQINSAASGYDTYSTSRLDAGQRISAGLSGGLSVGLWSAGAAGGIGRGLSYMDDVARASLSYADDAARVSSRSLAAAQAPSLSSTKALTYDPAKVAHQGGGLRSFTSQSDEFFYRVYSGNNIRGAFLTKVKPRSAAWAKEALALPPGNNADFIQRVTVPRGTVLQRSRALPNRWGRGGAEQFELLKQNGKYPHLHFEEGVPFK
jgi:RHS repeat-associated protein